MANQESRYQRVRNAFTPFLLVWEDYDRNNKIAQAEIDLNEKLNQLGYIDGQDITGQFIRLLRMSQSLDPERWRPLSDRLNIDFIRLLSEIFNSPEYQRAQRDRRVAEARARAARRRPPSPPRTPTLPFAAREQARAVAQATADAEAARARALARLQAAAAADEAQARADADRAAADEVHAAVAAIEARLENIRQRPAAQAATAAPPQRARKVRKTRVRSRKMRKMRKTRKN